PSCRAATSGPSAGTSPRSLLSSRLDGPDARPAVEEQPGAVAGDGHVLAVREREEAAAGARVGADDAVREAAGVDDAVDDRGRAGDASAEPERPLDGSRRGGDAVEDARVRAEVDASAQDSRR